MATYSKRVLSSSTNGRGIQIAAIATAGTAIHTAVAGESDLDEVWLYAFNSHIASVNLTLEWGGVTAPGDSIKILIPDGEGLFLIAPGLLLQNGLSIAAFASTANVIVIYGFVNRISA